MCLTLIDPIRKIIAFLTVSIEKISQLFNLSLGKRGATIKWGREQVRTGLTGEQLDKQVT